MKSILVAIAACGALCAQAPVSPEPLSAWRYYKELRATQGRSEFPLDQEALDKARTDAADLRLYDAAGREIPYVLRVRHEVDTSSLFTSHEFNRAVEGNSATVSCDLGVQVQEHNEVVIDTAGNDFRRFADVQGSADGNQWVTLAQQAILFRFSADGRRAEQSAVSYPPSRYRYVRVRVAGDPQVDHTAPNIVNLAVRRSVRSAGQFVNFQGVMFGREADRVQGRAASIWRVDVGGRVPVEGLNLQIGEQEFSRPFILEGVDGETSFMASGDLNGKDPIAFQEQFVRHLKLTVIDDRNPPLPLQSVLAQSAMRQVYFQSTPGAVRLYYGNPKALAPHYDLEARLPKDLEAEHLTLGNEVANPVYRPEQKPLSERAPWIVYLVLTAACAALAAILLNLARASAHDTSHPNQSRARE